MTYSIEEELKILKAEKLELSKELSYFKTILDEIPNSIYYKNRDGYYQWLNSSAVKSLRVQHGIEKSILGKKDTDVFTPKAAEQYCLNDSRVIETGDSTVVEELVELPDGQLCTQLSFKKPLYDVSGSVIGIIGLTIDITERKAIEHSLALAKKQAEAANNSKSEFIANMSHDLRTPITGILSMSQVVMDAAEKARESVNTESANSALIDLIEVVEHDNNLLIGATQELLNLCNNIIELVKLDCGKIDDSEESFSISAVMRHTIDLLMPVACNKQIALSYEIDSSVPEFLTVARLKLDRIIQNLASNALKFTNNGYVKIMVSAELTDNSKEQVNLKFIVEDSGIGIPADKLDSIFDHFSRLNSSYEGVYKGAGLGLYTVKKYLDSMGGVIDVQSVPGEGTKFIFSIPATVCSDSELTDIKSKPNIKLPESVECAKILIVEDSPLAAAGMKRALSSLNCQTDTVDTGMAAIEMQGINNYDLIFMDIGLPDISGIEASKRIRELDCDQASNVPIVAVTGHADNPEWIKKCMKVGIQKVLSKPATVHEFKYALKKYVYAEPELCVVDWDACLSIFQGDEEAINNLLLILDQDLKKTGAILNSAFSKKDFTAIRSELHRISGGISYLKVPQLEASIKSFHNAIRADVKDELNVEAGYYNLMDAIYNFQTRAK